LKEFGKTSTIGLQEFYVRRAYRMLPAAIVFSGRAALVSHGGCGVVFGEF
jgi:peptidoglycan/LPS O-acetylase OafA/YrhL